VNYPDNISHTELRGSTEKFKSCRIGLLTPPLTPPLRWEGSCWRCGSLPPTPPKRRGAAALITHASKSYKMSPHGTPSLWEGRGGPPVRMALPCHRRGGAGVGSVTKFIPLCPISQRDLSHLSEKTQPQPPQCNSTLTAIDET